MNKLPPKGYVFVRLIPYFAAYYTLLMRAILSERNLVIVLFVMVLITFSLAQEDSKKMEKMYTGVNTSTASTLITEHLPAPVKEHLPVLIKK